MIYNVKKGNKSVDGKRNEFRTFEDLDVYKVAREFRKKMYGVTRGLPDFEKYDLGSQIRRAAVSLTNNIAEAMDVITSPTKCGSSSAPAVRSRNWSMTSTSALTRTISRLRRSRP